MHTVSFCVLSYAQGILCCFQPALLKSIRYDKQIIVWDMAINSDRLQLVFPSLLAVEQGLPGIPVFAVIPKELISHGIQPYMVQPYCLPSLGRSSNREYRFSSSFAPSFSSLSK